VGCDHQIWYNVILERTWTLEETPIVEQIKNERRVGSISCWKRVKKSQREARRTTLLHIKPIAINWIWKNARIGERKQKTTIIIRKNH
jgi:hypothetical protein